MRRNQSEAVGRRVALLGLAGVMAPGVARAQVTPLPPSTAAPTPPPLVTTPAPPVVPAPPRPAAPAVTAIDKTKIYYVFFDQALDLNSMRGLRHQLTALVEAGVSQVVLVISSPGGQILETLVTYSFLRALPLQLSTHAQGIVASAATVLFLAGDGRSADPTAHFLFHPSQAPLAGVMSEQQMQEQSAQLRTVAETMEQIYRDRTKLTPEEIERFGRSQVVYTADQARELGVVQSVMGLKVPGPQTARIIFVE